MEDKTLHYQSNQQQSRGPRPDSNGMKYSIVIPAYNEAGHIADTIKSLNAQTVARKDFEVIVVDNNSVDDTYKIAKSSGADLVIKEATKGTNFARQAGFKNSKGDIVAFLDADCQPLPDWLEKIGEDLSGGKNAAVSGPFDYQFKGIKKIMDYYYTRYVLPNVPYILKFIFGKKAGVLIGGNFAAKREVIEAIGGLPPLAFWGDDVAIAMLISRRVGKVLFDPKVLVVSSPRRFEKNGFIKLTLRYIAAYFKIFFSKDFQ